MRKETKPTKFGQRLVNLACLVLVAFPHPSASVLADQISESPGASWVAASPESQGFDSAKLANALAEISKEEPSTHAVFLEFNGHVVLAANFYPYDGEIPHNVASVTKSVMTTLVAIAADQGKLNLDQPVLSFFPGRSIANRDARKDSITVRHLTGMFSGLDCVGEHDEPTLHQMNASSDWVQFTLDLKMVADPGTVFSYCSPGMHLLSAIVEKATGMTSFEFAKRYLFQPLDIKDVKWPADAQGVTHGWGDLFLLPGDAAKIGQLWLNGGVWNGKQIVSRDWVEASSRKQIATMPPWNGDYGYGWWIATGEEIPQFFAAGRGGQRISVFPTLHAVAVVNGSGINSGKVLSLIGTAMVTPGVALPENSAALAQLKKTVDHLKTPPLKTDVSPLPALAKSISGVTYRFDPNPLDWQTMKLDFSAGNEALITMAFGNEPAPRDSRIGLDGVLRFSPGEDGVPAGLRGRWVSNSEFQAEYDAISYLDHFDLRMMFEGSRVRVSAKERSYESGIILEGRAETE